MHHASNYGIWHYPKAYSFAATAEKTKQNKTKQNKKCQQHILYTKTIQPVKDMCVVHCVNYRSLKPETNVTLYCK